MNRFKEPLRSILDANWRKRRVEIKSDDLAGLIDFNRGSLRIDTRQKLLDEMTKEIRTLFDAVPNLKRVFAPAGDEEPKVPRERALWLVILEMPRGIALERVVREAP